jgi:ferredoxin
MFENGMTEAISVTITLSGRTRDVAYRPGDTILDTVRRAGLEPNFSCLQGNCANCMAKITAGSVAMRANHVLTSSELAEGYILTCQATPTSSRVAIAFDY